MKGGGSDEHPLSLHSSAAPQREDGDEKAPMPARAADASLNHPWLSLLAANSGKTTSTGEDLSLLPRRHVFPASDRFREGSSAGFAADLTHSNHTRARAPEFRA